MNKWMSEWEEKNSTLLHEMNERASEWVCVWESEWESEWETVTRWRRHKKLSIPQRSSKKSEHFFRVLFVLRNSSWAPLLLCLEPVHVGAAYWRASGKIFRILVLRGPEAWLSKERVSEWWRGGSGCNAWGACLLLGVSLVSEWVSVEWSVEWWKMEDKRRLTCMCVQCIHVVHYYSLLNSCTVEYSRSSVSSAEWVSEWVSE